MNNFEYTKDNFLCRKCGICNVKGINPFISGRGNINSKILILGEAPGKTENELKSPFVGPSGQMLNFYLKEMDIDCFISNSVKCQPVDSKGSNRTPSPTEIECCRPFTMELIHRMKPKVIIAVGRIAIVQLIKVNHILELMRGKKYYVPELDVTIIPTYHPAYILRTNNELHKRYFIDDLMLAKNTSLFPSPKKIITEPKSLSDPLDIKKYLLELKDSPAFAFDLETKGLNHRAHKITDISFCKEAGKGVHIRWNDLLEFNDLFKQVLETDNIKVVQNFAFEKSFLEQIGYKINGKKFDTMLAYHTLNMSTEGKAGGGGTATDLDTLSWMMTTEGGYKSILSSFGGIVGYQESEDEKEEEKEEQLEMFDSKKYEVEEKDIKSDYDKYLLEYKNYMVNERKKVLENLKITPLQYYSAMDSDVTFRIYNVLKPQIETNYSFVFNEIIMPSCEVLTKIKLNGIKLDYKYIDKVKKQNEDELEKMKEKFFNKIGYQFNLNSTHELSDFIFNRLGLTPNKKYMTKGGKSKNKKPAVDESALLFYSEQKPILKRIIEYRALTKENSTYLEGFKKLSDESTHRIYPDYYQLTATGRASCFLHTVPRNNKIRNIIIPDKGCSLITGDQSQIELRMLAMIANDTNMINAFASGMDIHSATACTMFGIPKDKFDKKIKDHEEKRTVSKSINFGIIFGQSPQALAESLGITETKAQSFMNKFFGSYPRVKEWIAETIAFVKKNGYVDTVFGRRRYLPKINSSSEFERGEAERRSINTIIQGTASDITSIALIRVEKYLTKYKKKAKLVGTVHDSIIVECPENEIGEVSQALIECMTQDIPRITIPLKADLDIQDRWNK